ncbi:MAG TPA: hypothetical protein VIP05_24945, partial [Burkholderiaceae bacterium]
MVDLGDRIGDAAGASVGADASTAGMAIEATAGAAARASAAGCAGADASTQQRRRSNGYVGSATRRRPSAGEAQAVLVATPHVHSCA